MIAMMLAAVTAAAPAAPLQQAFDAAEAKAHAGDWAGALNDFRVLSTRVSNVRTRAVIDIRIGECLVSLNRGEEAATAFRAGLEAMPKDAALAALRASAFRAMALVEETAFGLPQALVDYRASRDASPDATGRLAALAGMVRVGMFVDPAAAVVDADEALAILAGDTSPDRSTDKGVTAQFMTLKGRALLNAGQPEAAAQVLAKALDTLGGLTARLDQSDLIARSDAAIAALRAGRPEEARKYLAYTGAGSQRDGAVRTGTDMDPPACGESDDPAVPHPDDVAVVQFSIADDGGVNSVQPVFASRPGPMIGAFLDAVSAWSWHPDRIAGVKPFFRSGVRLEMRCSKTSRRPVATDILKGDLDEWMATRKLRALPEAGAAATASYGALRAELVLREGVNGRDDAGLLPVMTGLLDNSLIDYEQTALLAERAIRIATSAGAPATAVTWFRIKAAAAATIKKGSPFEANAAIARAMATVAEDQAVMADGRALAAVRLLVADADNGARNRDHARATLRAIVIDGRLGPRDPLRVAAQIRLASVEADAGDLPAARAAFVASGLDAMQCALVDAEPAISRLGVTSRIYPMEAARWGFEGWARSEFDITADGRTQNIRTVVAYPPFVFGDASIAGLKKTRYVQSYRPARGLGCGGETVNIVYVLPH